MPNGDVNIRDLLTTKNIAAAAAIAGFYLGTKTPGYVDKKLESTARQIGFYIQQGMAQGGQAALYTPIGGASGPNSEARRHQADDPMERLYQVVTVLAEQQGEAVEILKALKDYLPKNGA